MKLYILIIPSDDDSYDEQMGHENAIYDNYDNFIENFTSESNQQFIKNVINFFSVKTLLSIKSL